MFAKIAKVLKSVYRVQNLTAQWARQSRPLYLQVFFVVVVNDGQEDGHEDVGVDEDV